MKLLKTQVFLKTLINNVEFSDSFSNSFSTIKHKIGKLLTIEAI